MENHSKNTLICKSSLANQIKCRSLCLYKMKTHLQIFLVQNKPWFISQMKILRKMAQVCPLVKSRIPPRFSTPHYTCLIIIEKKLSEFPWTNNRHT